MHGPMNVKFIRISVKRHSIKSPQFPYKFYSAFQFVCLVLPENIKSWTPIKTFVPVRISCTIYRRGKKTKPDLETIFKGQRVVVFTQNMNHSHIYHTLIHCPSTLHTSAVGVIHFFILHVVYHTVQQTARLYLSLHFASSE